MEYNGFCVRVQALDGYGEKIRMLPQVADYTSIVAMSHKGRKGDNPHYHLVVATQVKDQAFRVRLKKVFNLGKGNEHLSLRSWDGNIDAISYLFHEDPDGDPFLAHNVSAETITKAKARNREVLAGVAKAKERASWKIEEELLELYNQSPDLSRSEHDIAKDIILHALRRDKYIPNDFLLKGMARKIQFKLLKGDLNGEEEFARNVVSSAYRMDYEQHTQWMSAGGGGASSVEFLKNVAPHRMRMDTHIRLNISH